MYILHQTHRPFYFKNKCIVYKIAFIKCVELRRKIVNREYFLKEDKYIKHTDYFTLII